MRDVKYGLNPVEFPPISAQRAAVQAHDRTGIDFLTCWDQHCLTIAECFNELRRLNGRPQLG